MCEQDSLLGLFKGDLLHSCCLWLYLSSILWLSLLPPQSWTTGSPITRYCLQLLEMVRGLESWFTTLCWAHAHWQSDQHDHKHRCADHMSLLQPLMIITEDRLAYWMATSFWHALFLSLADINTSLVVYVSLSTFVVSLSPSLSFS